MLDMQLAAHMFHPHVLLIFINVISSKAGCYGDIHELTFQILDRLEAFSQIMLILYIKCDTPVRLYYILNVICPSDYTIC